tara:strand:+ start:350 stop:1132 length:783 start_codon:yes stop_codon:yes gene_type:complete
LRRQLIFNSALIVTGNDLYFDVVFIFSHAYSDRMNKKMRDADTSIAFCLEGHFIFSGSGRFGGQTKDILAYQDVETISSRAKKYSLDYHGNMSLGINNLFHRRNMRVSGLPLFVQSLERYKKYPIFDIQTTIARADEPSPIAPDNMSVGEIMSTFSDELAMHLYLSKEDWKDFEKGAAHQKGVRFRFWFSEQIQKASGSIDGMKYHIKTDIEGIANTKDLGDGSARGNSSQTIKEFDIVHSGNIERQRVVFWAQVSAFGF